MDIEKLLDQLLMPPPTSDFQPFAAAADSLRNTSGSSLNRSYNSSAGSSSNSSWLSESSCGCHSPRSIEKVKSSLVFHKRSILPPVLCGSARAEMQMYKRKAIEKEQKLQHKNRSHLISRVEAILSSVNTDKSLSPSNFETQLQNQHDSPTLSEASTPIVVPCSVSTDKLLLTTQDNESYNKSEGLEEFSKVSEAFENSESANDAFSSDEETFHDNAYRQSLKNLLQKSMTFDSSLNETNNSTKEESVSTKAVPISSPSSSVNNTWADDTIATVILNNHDEVREERQLSSQGLVVIDSSATNHIISSDDVDNNSNVSATASKLVEQVLEGVMKEFMAHPPHYTTDDRDFSSSCSSTSDKESEIIENSHRSSDEGMDLNVASESEFQPLSYIDCDLIQGTYHSDDQCIFTHTSPCKTSEHVDRALELIGSKLVSSSNISCDNEESDLILFPSAHELFGSETSTRSLSSLGNLKEENNSLMTSITPEANELITCYKNVLEAQELKSPDDSILDAVSSLADASHLGFQNAIHRRTASTTSVDFECNAKQTESEVETDSTEESLKIPLGTTETLLEVKEARQSEPRVRRGSYSIDAPSPFLINTRETHTVYSIDVDDDDVCSETTEGSIFNPDVKRRLEMPSDSEESSIVSVQSSSTRILLQNDAKISDYCKMLEEQHKTELVELQRQHNLQLEKFKQELFFGQSNILPSYETSSILRLVGERENNNGEDNENAFVADEMHKKWCKFSALVKGHLTRRLLAARPVQILMKTVRDTSRTILSMRSEDNSSKSCLTTNQDASLMERLFLQLQAALYEFHETFFSYTMQEKMEIIAQSRAFEFKNKFTKDLSLSKGPRLSAATLKSLQRKKLERKKNNKGSREEQQDKSLRSSTTSNKAAKKEVKSKISYIWKTDGVKKESKSKLPAETKRPSNKQVSTKSTTYGRPLFNHRIMNSFTPSVR